MAKITIHEGLTFPGEKEYSSFRADVTIEGIDDEGDVEEQCKRAVEAVDEMAPYVEASLAQQAANVSGLDIEGAGIAATFAKFRGKFEPMWKELLGRIGAVESKVGIKAKKTKKPALEKPAKDKKDKPKKRGRPKK